jgi:hypothetical protein
MREHLRRGDEKTPGASPAASSAPVDRLLQLQRSAGNQAVGHLMVQRGPLDALQRGGQMYWGMDDVGAPFAKELMRWRLLGLGQAFVKRGSADPDWNDFMLGRPEIQAALVPVFRQIAKDQAAAGPTGNEWLGGYRDFSQDITGVRLNELESMRLTLHGCHRIEIRGRAHVEQDGADTIVRLFPKLTWIDVADLHPGTTTELADGSEVDDREFTAAGWDYDIAIMFEPVGSFFGPDASSKWRVTSSGETHEAGWPPDGSAPQGGRRG